MNLLFTGRVHQWMLLLVLNAVIIIIVLAVAKWRREKNTRFSKLVNYWYPVPLIFVTFKELYLMIKPIRQADFDYILIGIDKGLFGTDPTKFLHTISFPLLTEFLQIVYATFYFLPMILALSLFMHKKYIETDYAIF